MTKRPARVDHARCGAALVGRHMLRSGSDQHRETGASRAGREQDAHRQHQSEGAGQQRRQCATDSEYHNAARQHATGAIAISQCAGDRLNRSPYELPNRKSEADGDDAEPGRRIQRRNEQAERLPRAHRHHQHRSRDQRERPPPVPRLRLSERCVHRPTLIAQRLASGL